MSRRKYKEAWAYAIAIILIGALFIVGGAGIASGMMGILITIAGAIFIFLGIVDILSMRTLAGLLEIVVGVLMVIFAWTIAWVAFLVIGALLLVYGIYGLIKNKGSILENIVALLIGIAVIVLAFGVNRWNFVNIIFYIAGGLMIFDGLIILIGRQRPIRRR